jgi:hypothetical protein
MIASQVQQELYHQLQSLQHHQRIQVEEQETVIVLDLSLLLSK